MPKKRRRALKPLGVATNSGKFNLKRRKPSHPKPDEQETPNQARQPTPGARLGLHLNVLGPAWLRWALAAMNTSTKAAALLLLTGSLSGWSQSSTPSAFEVAANFTNYHRITTNVVFVNPDLAMRCRGASQQEVEAARVKFGPHANTGILVYMNKLAADAF